MPTDRERLQAAIERFDAANRDDPRTVIFQGEEYPHELLYAKRMTYWLERLAPDAGEAIHLAARSQHIRRWEIPRSEYPADRHGYHQWRTRLYSFHAETAAGILREVGYDEEAVARVGDLLRKRNLKTDPEMQLLEDVIGVVFLELCFSDFSRQHDEEKMIRIIQRTWNKMSPRGHGAALKLEMPAADRALIEKALAGLPELE